MNVKMVISIGMIIGFVSLNIGILGFGAIGILAIITGKLPLFGIIILPIVGAYIGSLTTIFLLK